MANGTRKPPDTPYCSATNHDTSNRGGFHNLRCPSIIGKNPPLLAFR